MIISNSLETSVLLDSPEEAAALCRKLRKGENSCRALGLACRFRGMETVRALVESGATFKYNRSSENEFIGYSKIKYWLALFERNGAMKNAYFQNRGDGCFNNKFSFMDVRHAAMKTFVVLPIEQRAEVVRYLCENSERVDIEPGELLFYSIMSGSKKITAVLREHGAKFSEKRVTGLTEDGRSVEWMEFASMLDLLGDEEYVEVVKQLHTELDGKPLHYTNNIYWGNYGYHRIFRMFKPEFFRIILENFNQKKMNKTQIMKGAIDNNSAECLEICADYGWLKQPKKRDEMIKYASDNGKTECSAWLLDFKNRTADLAAEREKAEKKMMAELNADPNSVSELKKLFAYETREDGTLIITRYKGTRTVVEVPEKIGKSTVTAIGNRAFSTGQARLKFEQSEARRNITKITLPETVTEIGEGAFFDCFELREVNIPRGVKEIKANTFAACKSLSELDIPEGVKSIGDSAFSNCQALSKINLPDGIPEICDYMLSGCMSLKTITLPKSIEKIGKWAFRDCKALETLEIPDGVTEVNILAFADCMGLKTIILPASIKKMKNYTYRGTAPQTVLHNTETVVTAVVEPKSYAEKYCKRNEIKFVYKENGDE